MREEGEERRGGEGKGITSLLSSTCGKGKKISNAVKFHQLHARES